MPPKRKSTESRRDSSKKSRKTNDQNDDGPQNLYTGKSLFTKMTKECGMVLMNGTSNNVIKKYQNVFLKDFLKVIKRHEDYPDVVEDIMEGVKKYVEDEKRFVRMMLTSFLEEGGDAETAQQQTVQDSVIRLLLKTQPLQMCVARALIEKLGDYKENSSIQLDDGSFDNQGETINVPQLILNQLRWLDVVEDADSIAVNLLDTASVMSYQSACVIVTSLPEIVGDEVHDKVAAKLKELLASNVELTIAILDTLCSLNCSPKAMEDIKNTIFSCLHSVKIEELPVVVKFLLQTMNSDNAEQNIICLRQHLTFSPASLSQNSQSSSSNRKEGSEVTSIRLTGEAILYAAQYQSFVADTWLKILKNLKGAEFTSVDVVTLIILCANYNATPKKSAISLMKTKMLSGVISTVLIQLTFEECSDVLIPYFSTLSDLASQFVASSSSSLQQYGSVLYSSMFSHFDSYCRQEVIGCLVQHVGSFCVSEVNAALGILRGLAVENLSLLAPFTLFIRGILDHVDRLTCRQVRFVYEVLSRLAFGKASNRVPTIEDELHMLIRKQLTHSSANFRYIGIIGAVNMLKILGVEENCDDKAYKTAASVLSLLEEATVHDNKTRAYYLDELCFLLGNEIDSRIGKRVFKMLDKQMNEKFLSDSTHSKLTQSSAIKAMFAIDKKGEIRIPIMSSVQSSDSNYTLLCPLFKAVAKSDGKRQENILNIASSPVLLNRSACDVKDFKVLVFTEQKMILDSLFVTLNWFREHLSAFTKNESHFDHALKRINHIVKLEKIVESLAATFSKYAPPAMILEFGQAHPITDITTSASTQEDVEMNNSNSVNVTCEDASSNASKKTKNTKRKSDVVFSIQSLKPHYMREMNASILDLLKIPMGEDVFEHDINATTSSGEKSQLFPSQLLFLLQDLKKKVCYKLPTHDGERKSSPFSSVPTDIGFEDLEQMSGSDFGQKATDLLPNLCNHLESVSIPFQGDGSDVLEDLEIDKRHVLVSCYESLLEVLLRIFSWKGIKTDTTLLRSALFGIGKRISSDLSGDSTTKNLLKGTFSYMKNFENTVTKVSLHSGTILAKTLSLLTSFEDLENREEFNVDLHNFTLSMLKADWSSISGQATCSGGKRNEMLAYILKLNLHTSDDVMKKTRHFVDEGLCKIGQDESPYPCFQKSNAHVLYSNLLENLTDETAKIRAIKTKDDENTSIELLLKWNDCMKIIGVIVHLLREFHSRANILTLLRSGRILIENFIKNGMPTCEKMFHLYQDDILGILKHLQTTTRQLQHLTCHSKVTKDISLSKQVPPLKKSLETLLFRVKGMLALHHCEEAFWLGNLKNRNIQGEELLSQMTQRENLEEDSANMTCEYQDMSYSESY